ncbi:hypothetical protein FOPG_01066 [Fusarium oxysporum f. sp. conglutinans race 2 54008]|uniref:Uncharacterized protein n=3 Tax=Fusarium oxysporum TaxID=5507 RepID=X0MM02_FUSOX|nr:hypothetical protein FOVG_09644 [Fusarium oxysporum f. sp. pisi HDV247]EXL88095.1 hypothetical protein FOPG_01066 [Fusarium oxysporum f. sp. conglutinans race 2 54008]EXM34622.1 hypothetical protein FOTG_01405 [Fusarium oxysporum f. sp. vasinfectum 25433]
MFTAMSNVVAEYSLFTSIISVHQSFKLPYATRTGYKLSWVTHCRGLWQGASLELHASPTLHLPPMVHLHNSESTDHPRQPWSPAPSIQGLPTKMQCSTWNSVAYCMHWDTSLVMLFRRL